MKNTASPTLTSYETATPAADWILGTLTKPRFCGFVILSAAKNLSRYGSIETLRFAQGDMGEV